MLAAVTTKYGPPNVLKLMELSCPKPKPNEVVIQVRASSVTAADTLMRSGTPYFGRLFLGILKPKKSVSGTGFAGKIEAIGSKVSAFKIGDSVFGETVFGFGSNAEFTCVPQDGLIMKMPEHLSFDAAATICDGPLTSMNFLKRLVDIKAGQRVLINGASGSLGTAAVQLAKYYGAHVTGVCSLSNDSLVRSLGADQVIDYAKVDFTKTNLAWAIIYDTVGKSSFSMCKSALTPNGIYLSPVLDGTLCSMFWTSMFGKKKAKFSATGVLPKAVLKQLLFEVRNLIKTGKLDIVIDRRYRLDRIVEAHQYVEGGHKKGNVVLEGYVPDQNY